MTDSKVTEVQAGTRRIARSVVVDARPHEVFELLADPRRHGELDGSGMLRNTISGPDRLSAGARFSVNMRQFGVPYRITSTVVAFDDGRVVEWRHPFGHTWRWELAETSAGGSEVTETFDYSGTKHAKFLEMAGVPAKNGSDIAKTLQNLRERFAS